MAVLASAPVAEAHLADEQLPENADEIVIPRNIPLLDFVRFTRIDHRLVLDRLTKGDIHHVGTMTVPLTEAALKAGEIAPWPAARLVWEMADLPDASVRAAYLEEKAGSLRQSLADLVADPLADETDLDTVRALLALVTLWLRNPMNGAGS